MSTRAGVRKEWLLLGYEDYDDGQVRARPPSLPTWQWQASNLLMHSMKLHV